MKKRIVNVVVALILIKPWYALAELDLSIPPEDTVLAMSDPDFSDTTHRVPTYSLNSAQQSNFTVGSGRASPIVLIAVAAVIAFVVVNNSDREK